MNRKILMAVLALTMFLFVTVAAAAENKNWFTRKDEGWFFYKSKPAPPKEIPPEPKKATPQVGSGESKPAHQRLKEHGELLLGKAMVNPTEENVREYMTFQKRMFDGADKFSQIWERVLANNPNLYLQEHYAEDVATGMGKDIKKLAKSAGVFFFFRSDCPYCHKQVNAINDLQRRYGFKVLAVSMDGGMIPGLQNVRKDNGIAANLGIKAVPAIYLAYPEENKFEPISQGGYLSIVDIERRMSQYVQIESEPDDYQGLSDLVSELNNMDR